MCATATPPRWRPRCSSCCAAWRADRMPPPCGSVARAGARRWRAPVATPVLDRLLSLEQAIYRPQASFDAPATLAAARTWLHAAARPRAWKDVVAEPGRV